MIFRRLIKKIHTGIVLVTMLAVIGVSAPFSPTLEIQRAEAQLPVLDVTNLVQTTVSAGSLGSLELKEFTLDGIAYSLAKKAISQMTSNIVQWINSGFQGSPMFVTDLGGFLTDIADQVAGDFIQDLGLGILCSPFQLNVRAALEIQYNKSKTRGAQSQCTFSGVIDNLENFATGFTNWSDWFEITTRPQNNQYGALLLAQSELSVSIQGAQGEEVKLLDFGAGFRSMKKCDDNGEKCQIVTPGATISAALNKSLGAGQDALIEADEIDEIINALFAQLAEQAVTGLNGLLGLSEGGGGNDSYLNRLQQDDANDVGFRYNNNSPIAKAIDREERVIEINRQIADRIEGAQYEIDDLNCSLSLPSSLENVYEDALTELTSANLVLTTLININTRYANGSGAARSDAYLEYLDLESAGYISTQFDVIQFETLLDEVNDEVEEFEDEIDDEC